VEFIYECKNSTDNKKYLKNNWYYIIALIPDYLFDIVLSFTGLTGASVILRAIRFIRVAKVIILLKKEIKKITEFIQETHLDRLLIVIITLIIISSITLFIIDKSFNDFGAVLWFVFITLSGVGYGDIVPSTTSGRIVSVLIIYIGIILFSILTGAITSIYTKRIQKSNKNDLEDRFHDLESKIKKLNKQNDKILEYLEKM
jgi:cell division protein FtsB